MEKKIKADLNSKLISKCCHDLSTPLTGALLAFDSISFPSSEKEVSDIAKKNLQKISLLLNIWRRVLGFSDSTVVDPLIVNDLKKLGAFNNISVLYATPCTLQDISPYLLKALCLLLYILLAHSCPGDSIEIQTENKTIKIFSKNLSFFKKDALAKEFPLCSFFYQFLEEKRINFSISNAENCRLSFSSP